MGKGAVQVHQNLYRDGTELASFYQLGVAMISAEDLLQIEKTGSYDIYRGHYIVPCQVGDGFAYAIDAPQLVGRYPSPLYGNTFEDAQRLIDVLEDAAVSQAA